MRLKDTKGKESTTLTMVVPGIIILCIKFIIGGATIFGSTMPIISAGEFGAAFALLIGLWLNREWKEAKHEKGPNVGS